MTAVPGVPVEGLTKVGRYSRSIYGATLADAAEAALIDLSDNGNAMPITDDLRYIVITTTRAALAAALPSLREVIAAGVEGPLRRIERALSSRRLLSEWKPGWDGLRDEIQPHVEKLRAVLSAPVQAATNGCDVCGAPSTHVTTPGGMRGCDDHFTGGRS